jgi:hypothetical protein
VTVDVTEEIVAGLHDRRFDLGLISLPVPEENLKINLLFDEELLIAGPATGKARRGYSIRASDPYSILSLSQGDRPAGDQHRFFKDIGVTPRVCDGGRRHGGDQAFGGIRFWLLHSSRTRTPSTDALPPNFQGGWTSDDQKPGTGDGTHGISPQVDRIDRGLSAHHSDRLTPARRRDGLSTEWIRAKETMRIALNILLARVAPSRKMSDKFQRDGARVKYLLRLFRAILLRSRVTFSMDGRGSFDWPTTNDRPLPQRPIQPPSTSKTCP